MSALPVLPAYLRTATLVRAFRELREDCEWTPRGILQRLRAIHPDLVPPKGLARRTAILVSTQKLRDLAPELHDHLYRLASERPEIFRRNAKEKRQP
jgi:hypothetical protein